METETFVLKPNSNLLDPDFEGYKLNLEKIPIHSKDAQEGVLQVAESAGSYSYQQVRMHALHNHLWPDPWLPHLNYYFLASGSLQQVGLDQSTAPAAPLRAASVLQLPAGDPTCEPAAHPSLSLTSADLALVSDGRGRLHLADTGDRALAAPWKLVFSDTLLEGRGFVLLHSLLDSAGALHVLTSHVTEAGDVSAWCGGGDDASFVTLLSWFTFTNGDGGWQLGRLRQAASSGTIHYACLETDGAALTAAADKPVRFTHDTERPVEAPPSKRTRTEEAAVTEPAVAEAAPLYVWCQTEDEVTMQLTVAGGAGRGVQVVLEPTSLAVTVAGDTLLQGSLAATVRLDDSTWTHDAGRVEVVLAKVERGRSWAELLVGDTRGQQTADAELAAEAARHLSQLTASVQYPDEDKAGPYNATELEDCDDYPEDSAALVRLDGETHRVTHQTSLASHQFILTARLVASEQPALCVRHDVDALLWQPRSRDGRWQCDHVGTLNAFGFVQASKQQRKFLTSSPDHSYAVICETSRHVYIYHQPSPVAGDLRNRKTGQRVTQVSRQQVVCLEDLDPILGVAAANGCLYVLTASHLHALVLN